MGLLLPAWDVEIAFREFSGGLPHRIFDTVGFVGVPGQSPPLR
ncbi:MAG: hypothetical protein QCH35_00180 [Methanomicrobiaceae archaeon]|nr:hypothetical protein [Methanomicrobiaceae archaeon]